MLSRQLIVLHGGHGPRPLEVAGGLRVVLALQTVTAVVTTMLFLGRKSLWLDEAYSFVAAHRGLDDLIRLVTQDESNMSPYYVALHFWMSMGRSEAWIRLLSVLPAVAAVPLFTLLVRHLAGARPAAVAGFALALDPMLVAYAQEARGYSLLVLCVVASSLLFVRAVLRPGAWHLLAWAAVSAAAAYVHYFGVLVTCAQLASLALLPDGRAAARRMLPATGIVLLLVAPIVVFIARRPGDPLSWVPALSPLDPPALVAHFAGSIPLAVVSLVLLAVSATFALRTLREHGRSAQAWRQGLLWLWLTLPPLLTAVVSLAHPLWVPRYLIVSLPPFLALVVIGLTRLRQPARAGTLLLLAALAVIALSTYYLPRDKNGEDWRAATAHVYSRLQPNDVIWFAASGRPPFAYYAWKQARPPVADLSLAPGGQSGRIHAAQVPTAQITARLDGHDRVWVVLRDRRGRADDATVARRLEVLRRAGFSGDDVRAFGTAIEVQLWSRDDAR